MADIKADVRRYIEDNFILGSRGIVIGDTDSFLERRLLDSTGFLELVGHLEETYGFKIEDDEMIPENLDSLERIEQFVTAKCGTSLEPPTAA